MTFTTELTGSYIRHFHFSRAFFHLEYFGMAIQTLYPCIGVILTVKSDFAHRGIQDNGLSRLNCLHITHKKTTHQNHHTYCYILHTTSLTIC